MKKFLLILLLSINSLSSFASEDISPYMNLKQDGNDEQLEEIRKKYDLRLKTMKEAAIQLGIQVGYNDGLDDIYDSISEIEDSLTKTFDYGALMRSTNYGEFEMYMLPGVVDERDGSVVLSQDGTTVRTTEKTFRLIQDERLVTEAPEWRSFIYQAQKVEVQRPFNAVLPKEDSVSEQDLWKKNFLKGYEIGVDQANAEVSVKARKMGNEFKGMVKYIRYVLEKKITPPKLSLFKEDVVVGSKELRINERQFKLTRGAKFNHKTGDWEVVFMDNRESLRKDSELQ